MELTVAWVEMIFGREANFGDTSIQKLEKLGLHFVLRIIVAHIKTHLVNLTIIVMEIEKAFSVESKKKIGNLKLI